MYAPYFNDGDPSEFSVNIYETQLNGRHEESSKEDDEDDEDELAFIEAKDFVDILLAIEELNMAPDSIMESVFTSNGILIISKDLTHEIESYTHD